MGSELPTDVLDDGVTKKESAGEFPINADFAPCINFGSWQNSVPFLRSLVIRNSGHEAQSDLRLYLSTSPPFLRDKTWRLERIGGREDFSIRDRNVDVDPGYLNGLNEAERGVVSLQLLHGEKLISESRHEVRILARDEWGGMASMPEILAAYVMPNDPAIAQLLKATSDILSSNGHSPALDGYQSGDARRAYMLVAALWSAIASKLLVYANPPKSFEQVGQKIRRPSTIVAESLATCLDTTLLFCAAIESIGLNPVVVMVDGHCFAGAWLVERTLSHVVETDCSEIRKAIAAKELLTFETTLVAQRQAVRFDQAVQASLMSTRESQESKFVGAIDIARARMSQIRPLASHTDLASNYEATEDTSRPPALPEVPTFDSLPADSAEEKPTTPAGRIERWQRKLLDLSLNNRLLNFKPSKQTVPIVCPNLSQLEDRLAAGAKLRLISLADHSPLANRDSELHRQRTNQEIEVEFARQALERDEISCSLSTAELSSRLTALYRKVQNDLAEGGSNTLYLAVGFLRWKRPNEEKFYRAPLLLVPAKLVRKSALSPFQLLHHEEDVRFNATLIQLMKKDFDRDISSFEASLPTDEHGVDVPRVLDQMRREVRDIPGFEVVEEIALSNFSFAKYLMWKDLVDRIGQLSDNRVVRHLIQEPDQAFVSAASSPIPRPDELDVRFEPKDIVHPLPADSSQLAAVMAASNGQDFVLVGPPGTGKSQTIANIISQCLATNKTVLFAAEKTAALDVVYRRLREHGLGDCCVELHSNRAERRNFLDQLESSWQNNRSPSPNEWIAINDRLKIKRDELNSYVNAIHSVHSNGWTAFRAFGVASRGADLASPKLLWPDTVQHNTTAYEALVQLVREIGLTYGEIDPKSYLPRIASAEWSIGWETALLAKCDQLKSAATALRDSMQHFLRKLGIASCVDGSLTWLDALHQLATTLSNCAGHDVRFLFHKQFATFPGAIKELQHSIDRYQQAKSSAAAGYSTDTLEQIPVEELDLQWRQAGAAYWPWSWFAKRKVRQLLQSYASEGAADPSKDLSQLRIMQKERQSIVSSPLAGTTHVWKSLDTDVAQLSAHFQRANDLRQSIIAVGQPSKITNDICKALHPFLAGNQSSEVFAIARDFKTAYEKFVAAVREYRESAGALPIDKTTNAALASAIETSDFVKSHRSALQRWTAWCGVRKRAVAGELQSSFC